MDAWMGFQQYQVGCYGRLSNSPDYAMLSILAGVNAWTIFQQCQAGHHGRLSNGPNYAQHLGKWKHGQVSSTVSMTRQAKQMVSLAISCTDLDMNRGSVLPGLYFVEVDKSTLSI